MKTLIQLSWSQLVFALPPCTRKYIVHKISKSVENLRMPSPTPSAHQLLYSRIPDWTLTVNKDRLPNNPFYFYTSKEISPGR